MTATPDKNAETPPASLVTHTLPWPPSPVTGTSADRLSQADCDLLKTLAQDCSLIIEVGTFLGASACTMLGAMPPHGRLVTIDTFSGAIFTDWPGEKVMAYAAKRLECWRAEGRATVICGDSVGTARLFADGVADMVFLDGAHDYDSVMADIRAWLPRIRPDGWLAGHDFNVECLDFDDAHIERMSTRDACSETGFHFGVARALTETFEVVQRDVDNNSSIWRAKAEWLR